MLYVAKETDDNKGVLYAGGQDGLHFSSFSCALHLHRIALAVRRDSPARAFSKGDRQTDFCKELWHPSIQSAPTMLLLFRRVAQVYATGIPDQIGRRRGLITEKKNGMTSTTSKRS